MTTDGETTPNSSLVIRVPKPNIQVAVLGLIAFITLFQTFQLLRISTQAGSAPVKAAAAPAAATGTGSSAEVPQSMVGGC